MINELTQAVIAAIDKLYGQSVDSKMVQISATKKEFEGDLTLVVFPFLKISKKGPEDTAKEIGEALTDSPMVAKFNVIKGFLNLSIAKNYWLNLFNGNLADDAFGTKPVTENSPLYMVEYSSPNTNKPLHLGHIRNNLLGYSLCKVLEANGYKVCIISQPKSKADFMQFGAPRLAFLVNGGNIDSMVAHYTAAKKKRSYDYYSPGGKMGKRPDRAVIVYCNRIREAFGDVPIIIGGLEASLRRFAHYDYWDNKIRRSILVDSRADILTYGMGENIILRLAKLLDRGVPVKKIRGERGCVYLCQRDDAVNFPVAAEFDFNKIKEDKTEYARAFGVQYKNQDAINGKAIVEYYDNKKRYSSNLRITRTC